MDAQTAQILAAELAKIAGQQGSESGFLLWSVGVMTLVLAMMMSITTFFIRNWMVRVESSLEKMSEKFDQSTRRIHERIDVLERGVPDRFVTREECKIKHGRREEP